MNKSFSQDEWTKCFVLIFNELSKMGAIGKKKDFVNLIQLPAQSTLNLILSEQRDFPIGRRQTALQVLRDKFFVNPLYFQNRSNPMFTQNINDLNFPSSTGARGMSYSEIVKCQKAQEENQTLLKRLEDKEEIIRTQAALIAELKKNREG